MIKKKGKIGLSLKNNKYNNPSFLIPRLTLTKYFLYFSWNISLNKYLDIKKHKVEPIVLAKDVRITPGNNPKSAPARRVFNNEMGSASAVTTM